MKSSRNAGNIICGHKKYEEDSDKCEKLPSLPKSTKLSKPPSIIIGFAQLLKLLIYLISH